MDVRLSPEQQQLRTAAARLAQRLGPGTVAGLDDARRRGQLASAIEAAGWRELRSPDEAGAPVASAVEVCLVAEELARALCDVAFAGPVLASELRRRAGAADAPGRETVLLDPALAALAVVATGDVPNGLAVDSAGARGALVVCADAAGTRLGWVEIEPTAVHVDLTRPTSVPTRAAVVPIDGTRGLSNEDLAACTALGLALSCADLVGVMGGAVELGRSYAVERKQFGRPIGSFQAVAHMLADAWVAVEGARSVALHAAWSVDVLAPHDACAAGWLAKAYCARAARQVCETVIQVHGGIGNTWDCLAHVFLRRALLSSDLFGSADACMTRLLGHRGVTVTAGSEHGLR